MLEKLIRLYGPSSHENSVADFIENELQGLAEVKRDCMGNIIAHIPGEGKKIMLAAHMDEIGIMVTFIDDNGFLRFAPVGGLAKFAILYTRVKFPSGKVGVISYPEKTEAKNLKISDMYIDIGASSREEAEKFVGIGDMAEFDSAYYTDGNIITSGKLDDRLGCYILIELAKRVKKPFCDLYLAFTVQEEIGLRGAVTATFGVEPDIAVAVDVTDTGDTPGAEPMAIKLGGGVAVKVKDGRMIASHEVRGLMESVCEENGIPYQLEILSGGTTDASVMQISRGGVKTGAVSVPTRYIHTVSETAAVSDIEATIKMLEKIVTRDEK